MKNGLLRTRRKPSLATTVGALLLTGVVLYGCVRLVGGMLTSELHRDGGRPGALFAVTPTPAPAASTPETAPSAAAVYAPTMAPASSSTPTPVATPAPTPAPVPQPKPTLRPIAEPAAFSESNMDLFLALFDETGADWISLISLRGEDCRVLGVPRNVITVAGTPIGAETSPELLMTKLPGVFPVRYGRHVSLSPRGLNSLLTLLGGISVCDKELDADGVAAYLSGGGDELLRIARQQEVLRGCLFKLRAMTLLDLFKSRSILQDSIKSNLTPGQLMDVYALLRRIDPEQVRFSLLPVDSLSIGGRRYYQCDVSRVNALAEALFPTGGVQGAQDAP